ncbi:agrin-like isoform X4 [Oculina patagonica]
MKKLQISCFLLLIGFSTFSFAVASKVTLSFYGTREKENNEPLLLKSNAKIAVKCEWSLAKNYSGKDLWKNTLKKYSGKVDIYSVSYDGFQKCNATEGKRLVSLKCGLNHHNNTKTLDFVRREGETYFLIGFARKKNNTRKRVLYGGTCESLAGTLQTKLILHFCDPAITSNGKPCTMKLPQPTTHKPKSSCNQGCPKKIKQVCGSDNVTYDNRCLLKKTACEKNKEIKVVKKGRCQVPQPTTHKPKSSCNQGCPKKIKQVCGSDNVTYDNRCLLKKTACEKNKEINVVKKGRCQVPQPTTHKPKSSCAQGCFFEIEQVCGSDNVTYDNKCFLEKAACEKNKEITIVKKGRCQEPQPTTYKPKSPCAQGCPKKIDQVCGSDNVTYDNKCSLEKAACENNKEITIVKQGRCEEPQPTTHKPKSSCAQGCPKKIDQVCGSDNVTYDNKCFLEKVACEKNKEITIVKKGRCVVLKPTTHKPKPSCIQGCPKEIEQVCGSDNVTYDNKCLLEKTACEKNKETTIVSNGKCQDTINEPKPSCVQGCSKDLKHVCGSDNVTYDNKCLLEKAACEKNKEITIVKNGKCQATTNEPKSSCDQECPKILDYVCGSDNVTYDNKCLLKKTACEGNKEIKVVRDGICLEGVLFHTGLCGLCPPYSECQSSELCVCPNCTHDGEKVCGSDGKTYNDFCKLQMVACKSNIPLKMVRNGRCGDPLRKPGVKHHNKGKSASSLKTFYICIIVMGVLGIAIALAMCMFQQPKSQTGGVRRNVSSRQNNNSFKGLHKKYRVGVSEQVKKTLTKPNNSEQVKKKL